MYFNSIKVQLEQKMGINRVTLTNNFNSIKVQLERSFPSAFRSTLKFQFHKGTIRTAERIL